MYSSPYVSRRRTSLQLITASYQFTPLPPPSLPPPRDPVTGRHLTSPLEKQCYSSHAPYEDDDADADEDCLASDAAKNAIRELEDALQSILNVIDRAGHSSNSVLTLRSYLKQLREQGEVIVDELQQEETESDDGSRTPQAAGSSEPLHVGSPPQRPVFYTPYSLRAHEGCSVTPEQPISPPTPIALLPHRSSALEAVQERSQKFAHNSQGQVSGSGNVLGLQIPIAIPPIRSVLGRELGLPFNTSNSTGNSINMAGHMRSYKPLPSFHGASNIRDPASGVQEYRRPGIDW